MRMARKVVNNSGIRSFKSNYAILKKTEFDFATKEKQ